ncbi:MAG: divalent-cation tolerance protein CutA [Novosphingobium sp.]|nr:divalent-cation tolerance protein CutA [Novosphingobium sp.]MCB2079104.1 divalent-cation tolerance protein CutA [Novosphingobium sp.]
MSEADLRNTAALVWCPFPDRDSATAAAHTLLDEGLIACANMIPEMVSLFEWNGERDEARETAALLKTNAARLDRAIVRLGELHPYDEPAIVGWRCDAAASGTTAWLGALGE